MCDVCFQGDWIGSSDGGGGGNERGIGVRSLTATCIYIFLW